MKRFLSLLFFVSALCCTVPDVATYGTVRVAIDCPEPPASWLRSGPRYWNQLGGPEWITTTPDAAHDVTVRCAELPFGILGDYTLASHEVLIDHLKLHDEFSLDGAALHELIHERVYWGPHPQRASLHVCRFAVIGPEPPECYPGDHGEAVMNPTVGRDRSCPSFDEACAYSYGITTPTIPDQHFFAWAMGH